MSKDTNTKSTKHTCVVWVKWGKADWGQIFEGHEYQNKNFKPSVFQEDIDMIKVNLSKGNLAVAYKTNWKVYSFTGAAIKKYHQKVPPTEW